MRRLILLLFMLPWWAYFPLAGGVVYLGQEVHESALSVEAERAAALRQSPPQPVDLSGFDKDLHIGMGQEVSVLGWINPDYTYTLVERTNGVKTKERFLFVLFGLQDAGDARVAKAAILFTQAERDRFLADVERYISSYQGDTPVFRIGGFAHDAAAMAPLVSDALREQGLRRSDDFFYLEPFLDGREAALAPQGAPAQQRNAIWAIALGVILFGLAKRLYGFGTKRPSAAMEPVDPARAAQVQAPGGANKAMDYDYAFKAKQRDVQMNKNITPDSPLGRLAARNAPKPQRHPELPDEAQRTPRPSPADPQVAPVRQRSGKTFRRLVGLASVGVAGWFYVETKGLPTIAALPGDLQAAVPASIPGVQMGEPVMLMAGCGVAVIAIFATLRILRRRPEPARVEPVVSSRKRSAHAVNRDPREQMRADPFDKLAQETH